MADTATVTKFTYGEAIGQVESLNGIVNVLHTDGTESLLGIGAPVYQGDVIATGDDGAVGVVLADQTVFSMAENGQITLDEMVYDAATQDGTVALTAAEGVFTFVSGMVAKVDPEAMTIDTPMATIGIRGTQLGLELGGDKGLQVVLMEEEGGFTGEVVVTTRAGVMVLNTPYQGTSVANANAAPTAAFNVPKSQMLNMFGGALGQLPGIGDANTYGADEASVEELVNELLAEEAITEEVLEEELAEGEEQIPDEELAEFDTAAGDEAPDEAPLETITVVEEDYTEGQEFEPLDVDFTAPPPVAPDMTPDTGARVAPTRVDEPAPAFNIEPIAFDETATTAEDKAFSGQLTATDYDQDVLTFNIKPENSADHGTVEIAADGSFTYTPDADYSGTDTFTFTVDDGQGGTDTATVTVNVTPIADQPTLSVSDAAYGTGAGGGEGEIIYGGRGEQTIVGTGGDDIIYGGQADDVLYGGTGGEAGEGGGEVALDIGAALSDIDTSETLSVTIAGVPEGAELSGGSEADGVWTLQADDLDGLTMSLPEDYAENFQLDVAATATETGTPETATETATINVGYAGGEGSGGDDVLFGEQGADVLYGGGGDDTLSGGRGADVLVGGAGDDTLEGGKGLDSFIFGEDSGSDIVTDYSRGETLRFEGEGFTEDAFSVDPNGGDAIITFGGQDVEVTVNNLDLSEMGYTITPDADGITVVFDDID